MCRVVEADLVDILQDAWAAIAPENDTQEVDHEAIAAQVIDAADSQDQHSLEAGFKRVQATYDDHTLGEISDRILIYTVQKGWVGACDVRLPYPPLPLMCSPLWPAGTGNATRADGRASCAAVHYVQRRHQRAR